MLDWRQGGRVWCCCSHQVRSGGQGNRSRGQLRKENGLRVGEEERNLGWLGVPHLGKLAEPMTMINTWVLVSDGEFALKRNSRQQHIWAWSPGGLG